MQNANQQSTNCVVMVRPNAFAPNPNSAEDNRFSQGACTELAPKDLKKKAIAEANSLRNQLLEAGVEVIELDGPADAPDGVFPNNWFITTEDGRVLLCPMKDSSRRRERAVWPELKSRLRRSGFGLQDGRVIDLSYLESKETFLEGTGSLVLDRTNRTAYAAISERTTATGVKRVTDLLHYKRRVTFNATDPDGRPIYHTNVLLSIGTDYAVICPEVITDEDQRKNVLWQLRYRESSDVGKGPEAQRKIIEISWKQLEQFCGNVLELTTTKTERIVVMSETAFSAFSADQLAVFDEVDCKVVKADISTIEHIGGGSVRCMLAEIFLPRVSDRNF